MSVVQFRPTPPPVDEILDDAFYENYKEVMLVGIKDGDITIHHTDTISRTRLIGALEMAKHQLLSE